MKAIGFNAPGGPEVLQAFDIPEPTVGPNQVRVRVLASAVNPTDLLRVAAPSDAPAEDEPRQSALPSTRSPTTTSATPSRRRRRCPTGRSLPHGVTCPQTALRTAPSPPGQARTRRPRPAVDRPGAGSGTDTVSSRNTSFGSPYSWKRSVRIVLVVPPVNQTPLRAISAPGADAARNRRRLVAGGLQDFPDLRRRSVHAPSTPSDIRRLPPVRIRRQCS